MVLGRWRVETDAFKVQNLPEYRQFLDFHLHYVGMSKDHYPKYCGQKYRKYPFITDGLSNAGLTRYFFMINDPLTVRTATAHLHGGDFYEQDREKAADSISVEGSKVKWNTFRSGG